MKFTDHLFYVIVIILVAGVMFMCGEAYKWYTIKPVVIDNHGGHYDMTSGDFVWGGAPLLANETAISGELQNAMPIAQPKGGKHGG